MGGIGNFGRSIRDRLGGTAVVVVLALVGLGAGVAGLVIALDAKDTAEEASSTSTSPVSVPTTTAPDDDASAKVNDLNERVAAIERSVARLRSEGIDAGGTGQPAPEEPTTSDEPPPPEAKKPTAEPEPPPVGSAEASADPDAPAP